MRPTGLRGLAGALLFAALLACAPAAHAEFIDEITVYADDISAPGRFGTELHVNFTPSGRQQPRYLGEVPPGHLLRVTPEFTWGLAPSLELGVHLPFARLDNGEWDGVGAKVRLKWLPKRAQADSPAFAGLYVELNQLKRRYSESPRSLEVRTIFGLKTADWVLSTNPIFGWKLSPGFRERTPELLMTLKGTRRVSRDSFVGFEFYNDLGPLDDPHPRREQASTLYLVWDYSGEPFDFNLGVGRGLTATTDRWTVKAIIELPFH